MYNLFQQTGSPYTRKSCSIYTFAPLSDVWVTECNAKEMASPESIVCLMLIEDYAGFFTSAKYLLDDTDKL